MKNELVIIKCSNCIHAGICKYTNDYMAIRKAIMNITTFSEGPDSECRAKCIENCSFISDISIGCVFYSSLAGVTLTCSPTISKDSTGYTEIKNVVT